jgi:hypothetical protein
VFSLGLPALRISSDRGDEGPRSDVFGEPPATPRNRSMRAGIRSPSAACRSELTAGEGGRFLQALDRPSSRRPRRHSPRNRLRITVCRDEKVERYETLAAPDAHSANGGWGNQPESTRSAKVITYSRKFGEVGRNVITLQMVMAASRPSE